MQYNRGKNIHSHLFLDKSTFTNSKKEEGNGRSKKLIGKRNTALFHRYIFFSVNTNNRFDVIIYRLSDEFYLSPVRISEIISDNLELIRALKKEKINPATLKKLHPHFDWKIDKSFV